MDVPSNAADPRGSKAAGGGGGEEEEVGEIIPKMGLLLRLYTSFRSPRPFSCGGCASSEEITRRLPPSMPGWRRPNGQDPSVHTDEAKT